jgi:phosphoglycolate phosphatase
VRYIGFDFDLTLVDSTFGIIKTVGEILANFDISFTESELKGRLSLPLAEIFEPWKGQIDKNVAEKLYLEMYPEFCLEGAVLLPGVQDATDYLIQRGYSIVIISAKKQANLELMVKYFQLDKFAHFGDAFLSTKSELLREYNCLAYIGDHPFDVVAARRAKCSAIITQTGNSMPNDFMEFPPDFFIKNLLELPETINNLLKTF